MNVITMILGAALIGLAFADIKYREIPVLPVCFLAGIVILVRLWKGTGLTELLLGLFPGILLLLISYLSHGSIGTGDGLVLCVIGLGSGMETTVVMLGTALFVGGIYAAIMLFLKKVGRKTEIPFLPFLLLGYFVGVSLV